MRISRIFFTSTLALSLPLVASAQQPGAPAIPRAEPNAAPSGQQPGRTQVQPGQIQPGQAQPLQTRPAQPVPSQAGQPQTQPNRVTANKPVVGEQANQQATRQVASLLAICNQKEVKLAELAKSKSESKDVKEFAEMMIKDHSEMLNKLNQFGGQANLGSANTNSSSNSNQSTAQNQNQASDQNRATTNAAPTMQTGALDFVAVQRHAAQECLSKAEKHWSEHKGEEADMAYIGAQLVAHEEMLNQLTALRPYASPELQKVIDNGMETTKEHRDHAHKIIKKLSHHDHKKS